MIETQTITATSAGSRVHVGATNFDDRVAYMNTLNGLTQWCLNFSESWTLLW